jgi:anti-anti-sigma factor
VTQAEAASQGNVQEGQMFVGDTQATPTRTVYSCSVAREATSIVADVIGEVDAGSAGQFRNQLLTMAKEHPAAIVLDMTNASLLDDTSLAVVVEVWQFTQEHGIGFTVKSAGPSIRRVFDVAPSGQLLTLR